MLAGETSLGLGLVKRAAAVLPDMGYGAVAGRIDATRSWIMARKGDVGGALDLARAVLRRMTEGQDLPVVAYTCACMAQVAAGRQDPDETFAPVLEWHEREPSHLSRMNWLVARLSYLRGQGDGERSRGAQMAARAQLSAISRRLSSEDRLAIRMHPWTRSIGTGSVEERESIQLD